MAQARKPTVPRHRSHNLPPRDGQQLKKNVTPKLGSRIVTIVQTQRKCYMCFEGLRSTLRSLAIAHRAVTETIGKRVSRYERSRYSSPLLFNHGGHLQDDIGRTQRGLGPLTWIHSEGELSQRFTCASPMAAT